MVQFDLDECINFLVKQMSLITEKEAYNMWAVDIPWLVVIQKGMTIRQVYRITDFNRYVAIRDAVLKFIEEFNLPGKVYDYRAGGKFSSDIEITTRCGINNHVLRGHENFIGQSLEEYSIIYTGLRGS